jgi:hypothetical protein
MIEENDVIKANKDINDEITFGTKGIVLSVYQNGEVLLIEFLDINGNTIGNGMETVKSKDVILVKKYKKDAP